MKQSVIKSLFSLIITCVVVGCAPISSSENVVTNKNEYDYIVENNEVKLLKFNGEYRALITIPEYIDGLKVTSIGANCFKKDSLNKKNKKDDKEHEEDVDNELSDYSTYIINENITDIEEGSFEENSTFITPNESEPEGWKDENIEGNAKNGDGNVYFDTLKEDSIVSGGIVYVKDRYLNGIYVARCLTKRKEVEIPSEIKGMKVIDVGRGAFAYNEKIEKVTLPDTIGYIQRDAFYNCINLEEVICTSLNLSKILSRAFEGCVSLDIVKIPENCTYIASYAYANCGEFSQLFIPFTMTNIAEKSFENTTVKQIIYNGSEEQWGYIKMAADVIEVFNEAEIIFTGSQESKTLNRLNEILNVADNTIVEFKGVITGWYNTQGVFVTDPIDKFSILCYNVKGLPTTDAEYIGKTVKVSGNKIRYTGQLEVTNCQIEILDDPKIEIEPIKLDINDPNLDLEKYINYFIIVEGTLTDYDSKHIRLNNKDIVIYCPYNLEADGELSNFLTVGFYLKVKGWGVVFNQTNEIVFDFRLVEAKTLNSNDENGFESDDGFVFYDIGNNECAVRMERTSNVEEVVIPSTYKNYKVTKILTYGFYNNTNIKKVTLPTSLTIIDYRAFSGCSNLENVIFPTTLKTIGYFAFYECSSLTEVSLTNINSIGENAFNNCTSLKNVTLLGDIESIKYNTFKGCSNLENVIFPTTIKTIEEYAFQECSSLSDVSLANINYIGEYAFNNCTSLKNVTLLGDIESIKDNTFEGCSSLESIILPASLTSIGAFAFKGCSSLKTIVIPENVTNIGYHAFFGCNSLTIYCESLTQSSDWDNNWNPNNRVVYLGGDWDYDENMNIILTDKYYGLYVFSYVELYSLSGEYLGIIYADEDSNGMFSETFYCLQITSGKDYENGFECNVTIEEGKVCISYKDSDVCEYFEIIETDGKIMLTMTTSDQDGTYVWYMVKK